MANTTKNYGLNKPTQDDFYDIDVHNQNMDVIDEALKTNEQHATDSKIASESGVHGFRYYDDEFQVQNEDGTWVDLSVGGGLAPSNVTDARVKVGNGKLTIFWSDPGDTVIDGKTLCTWKGTKLVQKAGAFPESPKDGTVVVDNQVLNTYKTSGFEVNGLTNGVTYYFALFPYSDTGAVNMNEQNRLTGVPQPYKTMTAVIDLSNSNPDTCVTYADDAVGMEVGGSAWDAFFGHYPVLFKDGVEVGKLNRDNFSQFEDGTAADLTGDAGDAMICFPRKGLKISTSGTTVTVSMTDDPNSDEFEYNAHTRGEVAKERFYLGVYKGFLDSTKLRSIKNKMPTSEQQIASFRNYARNNGEGYDQSGFYQLTFRQAMFILKYKTLDSQTAVGKGGVNFTSSATSTGGTEAWGMDCEIVRVTNPTYMTDGKHHVKLFGIEDFWGNIWEFIDGVMLNSINEILTGNDNFNNNGDGYINNGNGGIKDGIGNYMSAPHGTTKMGFLPKETKGSSSTYFCDFAASNSEGYGMFGGSHTDDVNAGVFRLYANHLKTSTSPIIGARLMYL